MRARDLRTERWPRSTVDGEGLEPTAIFLHADAIVRTARASARGPDPAVMERALVGRILHDLAAPVANPFLAPPGPHDPPAPWDEPVRPARRFAETRTTLAAAAEPRRRPLLPAVLFVFFAAATFAMVAEPATFARAVVKIAAISAGLRP